MELDLWQAFLNRPDLQQLSSDRRLFLIELGAMAANLEDESIPDGFLPAHALKHLWWDRDAADGHIAFFIEQGWLRQMDDPEGFQIDGWLDRAGPYIPGAPEYIRLRWGQQPKAKRLNRRVQDRDRKARQRAREKSLIQLAEEQKTND